MDTEWGSAPNPAKGTVSLWNPVMYNKLGADITVGTFFAAYANSPKAYLPSGCLGFSLLYMRSEASVCMIQCRENGIPISPRISLPHQ